jgi:hypothetical protein
MVGAPVSLTRLLAAKSLNQSRAVPELWLFPMQETRVRTSRLMMSPDVNALDGSDNGTVRSFALLNPLLPPSEPRSVPALT